MFFLDMQGPNTCVNAGFFVIVGLRNKQMKYVIQIIFLRLVTCPILSRLTLTTPNLTDITAQHCDRYDQAYVNFKNHTIQLDFYPQARKNKIYNPSSNLLISMAIISVNCIPFKFINDFIVYIAHVIL